MIDILEWIVEFGCIDMTYEVFQMDSMITITQLGHLDQVYHILGHLRIKHNVEMIFNPMEPYMAHLLYLEKDWTHTMYCKIKENIPTDAPNSGGLEFIV